MADKQDGVNDTPGKTAGGGESEGGAYPNPHEEQAKKTGGFFGHGGQTEIDYSGPEMEGSEGNENAVTEGE